VIFPFCDNLFARQDSFCSPDCSVCLLLFFPPAFSSSFSLRIPLPMHLFETPMLSPPVRIKDFPFLLYADLPPPNVYRVPLPLPQNRPAIIFSIFSHVLFLGVVPFFLDRAAFFGKDLPQRGSLAVSHRLFPPFYFPLFPNRVLFSFLDSPFDFPPYE